MAPWPASVSDVGVALCAIAMAVGLIGTLVPLLPGLSLIWVTALVYGAVDGFGASGLIAFALITLLLGASVAAKIALPHRRARAGGAPTRTLLIGALAGLVGFFVIPVVGLALGAVLGVLAAEYQRTRDRSLAWASTKGVIVGMGLAAAVEFGAGVIMVVAWVGWVLTRS